MVKINSTIVSTALVAFWIVAPTVVQATCNPNITVTAPDIRYTDHGDGSVTDRITGLMWKQCSEGQNTTVTPCDTGSTTVFSWSQALQEVERINNAGGFAGFTDWRLPNRNELSSLVEYQCFAPAVNTNLFPNTANKYYWTSSPRASASGATFRNYAWRVHLGDGQSPQGGTSGFYRVRLVRGGL